jgi:hypothetical protein
VTNGSLKDGEPCGHPGCLFHVSHPCEGCGRVAGKISLGGRFMGLNYLEMAETIVELKQSGLNDWEREFLENVLERYNDSDQLSEKQCDKIEEIHARLVRGRG